MTSLEGSALACYDARAHRQDLNNGHLNYSHFNCQPFRPKAGMINDRGLVIINPLGKFH